MTLDLAMIRSSFRDEVGKRTAGRAFAARLGVAAGFTLAILIIPWPSIWRDVHGFSMIDRTVYYRQIIEHNLPTDFLDYTRPGSWYTGEFIWNGMLHALTRWLGIPAEIVFTAVSAITVFTFALLVLRRAPARYLVLLVNPLVIDLAFSQLRSALALSMLAIAWMSWRRASWLSISFLIAAPLVHSTAPLFILFFAAAHWGWAMAGRYREEVGLAVLCVTGVGTAIATGPLRETLLALIGDRRSEYQDLSSSWLFLSFWLALLLAIVIDGQALALIETRVTAVVLVLCATNLVVAGYSTRFLALVLPLIVVAIWDLDRRWKHLPGLALVGYSTIQWGYWLGLLT